MARWVSDTLELSLDMVWDKDAALTSFLLHTLITLLSALMSLPSSSPPAPLNHSTDRIASPYP